MDYLLFRLYGPLAAWGEIAVGESRHTARYPGKSALIGLLAAALGIERNNTKEQQQMANGYKLAVKVYSAGIFLSDFHTAQVPDSVGKFTYRTRRDELIMGKARLGTILSRREYRSDALAVAAVTALPDAPYDLATIKQHLEKPRFHIYLGRKSCPLAAPMSPQISGNVCNFLEAFELYNPKPIMFAGLANYDKSQTSYYDNKWLGVHENNRFYYWEGEIHDLSDTLDPNRVQTRTRHDQPLSRVRWQFAPRQEHYYFSGGE